MKRLILSAGIHAQNGAEDNYVRYTAAINQAYAHIHNLKFEYIQFAKEIIEERHYSWARIPLLQKYVNDYDEILWINPDAIIRDLSINVFDYLKSAPQSKWVRNNAIKPIAYTVADKPSNDVHACTNVLLLDCTDKSAAKEFLNDWWNDLAEPKYMKSAPCEQSVWNFVWTKDEAKASRLRVADIPTMYESEGQAFLHFLPHYGSVQLFNAKKYFYKLVNMGNPCKKRIGIYMRNSNIYSNGAGMNCIFLKQALEATGHDVDLLVNKLEASASAFICPEVKYRYTEFGTIDPAKYCLVVFGSGVPTADEIAKLKAADVRTVVYTAANILDQFHTELFLSQGECKEPMPLLESEFHKYADECWIPETHAGQNLEYLRILNQNRIPIKTIPHVWSPLFTRSGGVQPKYKSRNGKQVDIVILEPNMSYTKCGYVPFIVAENLHLKDPALINKVYIFNTPAAAGQQMLKGLKLGQDGKIKYMSRMPINEILAFFANPAKNADNHVVFISHQNGVPYNYAYYDILSAGFPFIHNSKELKDKVGGYYSDFESGAAAIVSAIKSGNNPALQTGVSRYLETHDPYNDAVIDAFKKLVVCHLPKPFKYPNLEQALCLTYDNAPTENTKYFLNTLKSNGWDAEVVGIGEKWEGWRTRLACYKRLLESIPGKKVIILSDARDVFCLRGAQSFKKAFESFKKPIVTSMEIFCEGVDYWEEGVPYTQCMTLQSYWKHHNLPTPIRQFVNNGLVAGYAEALKEMVTWILDKGYTDDQFGIGNFIVNFPDKVATDTGARLLHTSTFGVNAGIQYLEKQTMDSPNFAELMGNGAYFLHIPGMLAKGQAMVYELIKKMLNEGINNRKMLKLYNFEEPEFDEVFACASSKTPVHLRAGYHDDKKSLKSRVQMITINGSPMRRQYISDMLGNLKIGLDHDFFDSFKPDNSKDYINFKTERSKESDEVICCSRSHGAAINEFVTNPKYSAKDIVLILEDDVTFIKNGFEKELYEAIELWEKHENEIDFVNIGYLFKEPKSLKSDGVLHWDMTGHDGTLWGAQAYLIKRDKAREIASVIHKNTSKELFDGVVDHIKVKNGGKSFTNKLVELTPDSYLSMAWRQGYIKPMLAMEYQNFESTISKGVANSKKEAGGIPKWIRPISDFYAPKTPTLTIT